MKQEGLLSIAPAGDRRRLPEIVTTLAGNGVDHGLAGLRPAAAGRLDGAAGGIPACAPGARSRPAMGLFDTRSLSAASIDQMRDYVLLDRRGGGRDFNSAMLEQGPRHCPWMPRLFAPDGPSRPARPVFRQAAIPAASARPSRRSRGRPGRVGRFWRIECKK